MIINVIDAFSSCRGRARTSKGQLVVAQSSVVDPGRLLLDGSMLYLSRDPHPRDKGACMPRFHHPTVLRTFHLSCFAFFPSFDISKLR
ncbi:MAG: hypothetical protein RLZ56_958 [Bacteroidota bacterium]